MRPSKLVIQGLTAYKQAVEIDFSDLDLFAITGPTGAGKSSLVDAITFALFGQAPRVGRGVKELISQGEERLKVSLEFAAGGERYRIHRATARKGQAPVQLERADDAAEDGWLGLADRVTEVNQQVEEVLRMDYEAFIRSVLLPQGQFQEFLAGDRDERRKVLDGLLQLSVYGQMQQRANAIAARETADADRIRERLETELKDATPEAQREAKARLKELKAQKEAAARVRAAADSAVRTAEGLASARERQRKAEDAHAVAEKGLADARALLSGGEKKLSRLDSDIAEVGKKLAEAAYDGDLHLRLSRCAPLISSAENAEQAEKRIAGELADAERNTAALVDADGKAKAALEAARSALDKAQAAYDEARHGNAAALLQSNLQPGDACPVCGQTVGEFERHSVAELDGLRARVNESKAAEERARSTEATAATALARGQQRLEEMKRQLKEAGEDRAARIVALNEALGDFPAAEVDARLAALEKAKAEVESLEARAKSLQAERQQAAEAIQSARSDVTRLETEAKGFAADAQTAAEQAAEAEKALRAAAQQNGWAETAAALDAGRDAVREVRAVLEDAQQQSSNVDREIGSQEARIEQIGREIELAARLREQVKAHTDEARLANDLASLLRTNAFPTFLRERAMRTLAEAGSGWLREISSGRYDLRVEGQDFEVEDLWNASEPRSVKTLSGGETFLASLALALALAEHLPALGGSGAAGVLESLFIDEGFSHLDAETLDIVASALEVLGQDRRRLIGVVTHVPALAERMPARITVHKSQAGSTVSVE